MAKIKIYEYAKQIDKPSKELVEYLIEKGCDVKSHMSSIEDKEIEILDKRYKAGNGNAAPKREEAKATEKVSEGEVKPVASSAASRGVVRGTSARAGGQVASTRPVSARSVGAAAVKKETVKAEKPEKKKPEVVKPVENKENETKKVEAPKMEAPKAEVVKTEAPKTESKVETTKNEAVKSEAKVVVAKTEVPKTEAVRNEDNRSNAPVRNNEGRDNRQGGYNKDNRSNEGRDNRQGGFNRDNRNSGRDNRQGGFNKDNRNNEGRDNRQGGFNRDNRNNEGRDNRQGGFNRDNRNNEGRDNRQGGFNRDNRNGGRDNRQGGYNRDNRNNEGRDNRQGGFNRNDNRDNRSGSSRDGRNDNRDNRGGFSKEERMVSSVFNPANSGKNPEGSRNSRANWNNKKNDKDKRYDDSRENFDGLNKKSNKPKKGQFIKPEPVVVAEPDDGIKTITLPEVLTIKELADAIKIPVANLVKKLLLQGKMVNINQEITFEDAEEIALEYNCIAEMEEKVDVIAELLKEEEEDEETMVKRPPVVCVMGHVDHGKTSLLDAIRNSKVTDKEAGGITQHIGAYTVRVNDEKITFLDTPGHEAFTSMRMRGANSTDIAILVVAADDGVMPQTVEAINHAKAAGVQIIVAVNKIDKPSANIERVKQELVEHELVAEDWGGDTVFVPVSAHTKEGIDTLLEMIVLTAEMLELKANRNRKARGLVIEAQLDKGRGPVATVLIQKGTLRIGDPVTIGSCYGKVRAMVDDKGKKVRHASPSKPVEILGLNDVPNSGEILIATETEKEARSFAEAFIRQEREKLTDDTKHKLSLDGLFSQIQAGNIKELNIIVKADVQGSVEAVKQSLLKLSNDEVAIKIIHGGVGAVNESDVTLASASNAIIIGFNVRPDNQAKEVADREKVDLRLYKVIYNAIEDVEAAMKGMLDPIFEEKIIAHAEVRQVFKASGVGTIAGSYVLDGKIVRGASARITRDGELIYTGALASLKRFKDDVKEVATGYECGLVFEKFNDAQEFDQIEFYVMEEVPR